jgi:DNA-binding FadR family transcriptional regulator
MDREPCWMPQLRGATRSATSDQLGEIDPLLARRRAAHDSLDPDTFTHSGLAFRRALQIYDAVADLVADSILRTPELGEDPASLQHHAALAASLRRRDPVATKSAATTLLEHLGFLAAVRGGAS